MSKFDYKGDDDREKQFAAIGKITEAQIQEALALALTAQGFTVYREVSCVDQEHRKGRLSLDLLVLPPPDMRHLAPHLRIPRFSPFTCIGLEVKAFGLTAGMGYIEPIYQVKEYMRSFRFLKDGVLLPRPQTILLVNPELLLENMSDPSPFDFAVERMLWKVGGTLLRRSRYNFVYRSNAAIPSSATHYLAQRDPSLDALLDQIVIDKKARDRLMRESLEERRAVFLEDAPPLPDSTLDEDPNAKVIGW